MNKKRLADKNADDAKKDNNGADSEVVSDFSRNDEPVISPDKDGNDGAAPPIVHEPTPNVEDPGDGRPPGTI